MVNDIVPNPGTNSKRLNWSPTYMRATANADTRGAALGVLDSIPGARVLPLKPGEKPPHPTLCPRGHLDATDDPVRVREWWEGQPDAGLGFVPGPGVMIADDDRGGLLDMTPLGFSDRTYADRTPRGLHVFGAVPEGFKVGRRAKLPGGKGDVIGGLCGYVVLSPTPGYFPSHPGLPILPISIDSPLWELVRPQRTVAEIEIPNLTESHHREARRIIAAFRQAPPDIACDVESLLEGQVPPGASESEADYRLALLASYWSCDSAVIMAVLVASKLTRKKWTRPDYLPRTIAKALDRRAILSGQGPKSADLLNITEHIATGCGLQGLPLPPTVSYGTPPVGTGERQALIGNILAFATAICANDPAGAWALENGWVRVPINHFAAIHQVNRKTIQRAIKAAERQGLIESTPLRESRGGRVVCQRVIRLRQADAVLLTFPIPVVQGEREEVA